MIKDLDIEIRDISVLVDVPNDNRNDEDTNTMTYY